MHLTGTGTGTASLEGAGTLDVPSGRIEKLPWLIDLLKLLKLRAPDRTAFEEAHAAFQVRGPRVNITRLDLFGDTHPMYRAPGQITEPVEKITPAPPGKSTAA